MAISAATMTVTITEAVTLNGAARGNTNTLTLSNIHEVVERTVTVPTSEVELIPWVLLLQQVLLLKEMLGILE